MSTSRFTFGPGTLRRGAPRVFAVSALLLVAWACQDATGPAVSPDGGAGPRLGRTSVFQCSTLVATPDGTRQGQFPLHFPAEVHAADGSTMEYRYRRQTPSRALTYSADCVIPRTMPALEMMNRRFQVPPELGAPRGRNREGGEFTTQGCVDEGECFLETIVVVAPAPPATCDRYCGGGSGMPGTDTGSGGWTGGAGGGGSGGSGDDDGGAEMDRSGEWDGQGELLACPKPSSSSGSGYTQEHCDKIEGAIDSLKNHSNAQCKVFGQNADQYFHGGNSYFLWSWSGPNTYGGYANGSVGLTAMAFNPGELANTIAHEEAHRLGWPDRYKNGVKQQPASDGRYADDWGKICKGAI